MLPERRQEVIDSRYCFTRDYVSPFTKYWEQHLGHLRSRPGAQMLEIGSFEGRSALWFLENILTGEGSGITCVDGFWPPYGEVFDRNIAASGHGARVRKLAGKSHDVLPGLRETFDAFYIDGGHREDEVWEDALECWRLSKPGSVLTFDDFMWRPDLPIEQRPARAIRRFLLEYRKHFKIRYLGYQVVLEVISMRPLPAGAAAAADASR